MERINTKDSIILKFSVKEVRVLKKDPLHEELSEIVDGFHLDRHRLKLTLPKKADILANNIARFLNDKGFQVE